MGNLLALLPNATLLVSRFLAKMSKKRQRCAVVNLKNNFSISAKFTHVYCNCEQQLSQKCGKMGFTIEGKALIDNRFFERWATNKTTVHRRYNYRYD
jgi:phenylalanyl-tRNA synthetase alpha subunit